MKLALFAIAALIGTVMGDEPMIQTGAHTAGASQQPLGEARILASKFLLSNYAVVNKEFVVDYRIYNVGDKPALQVTLDDRHNFPTNYFTINRGLLQVRWDRIGPGANVTHSVAITPLQFGSFNYTQALISYLPSEDADVAKNGYSSAPGEGYIYQLKDYEKRFSPHHMDWVIFVVMAAACLSPPAWFWYRSSKKYEIESKKKNQ